MTEFGGSELQQMVHGKIFGKAPAIDLEVEASRQQALLKAIQSKLVQSATDLSEGGFAIALCEKAFDADRPWSRCDCEGISGDGTV